MAAAIVLLALLCAGLCVSLLLLKREIRSIKKQLADNLAGVGKPVSLVFIDKGLTGLAALINKSQAQRKDEKLALVKREDRLKEAVSSISHDLRTPLTSLLGYLQLLQKTALTAEQGEYLAIALSRGRYLQTLIADFFMISVLEDGDSTPVLDKIRLDTLLTDIVLSFAGQLEEEDITPILAFPGAPAWVMAEETMLRRILTNLVSNAISHGARELKIAVLVNGRAEVRFQNKVEAGSGIDVSKLFDKGYTGGDPHGRAGAGLGLYIVKLLAEKMGGGVRADFAEDVLTVRLFLVKA